MVDIFTKKKRSEVMARIKGRNNKTTEMRFAQLLRAVGVKGWRRHKKVLGIRPDFVFLREKTAIFIDGCFWHGCQACMRGRVPKDHEHAKGHRHTAEFKSKFRRAVAKPRPAEVAERIRESWREKLADPAAAAEHRARRMNVAKAVARKQRRGELGRYVGE